MTLRLIGAAFLLATSLCVTACDRGAAPIVDEEAAAPTNRPVRKPGLWRQSMLVGGSAYVQDVKFCLDAQTDEKVSWWGKTGLRSDCFKDEIIQKPDGSWHFSSVCVREDHVKMTTEGTAVGDFQRRYQLTAETTISNPVDPRQSGTRTMTLDSEWLGPCPDDMRPGQLNYPDGQSINLLDMALAAEAN
jgi:hypothetical protein